MPEPMSDAEALLWSVEQDPRLASTMGALVLLDAAPDPARLEAAVTGWVAAVARLRQRVVPAAGPLVPPAWASDDAFDLAHHVRHVRLPPPGSLEDLQALAAQLLADPFDRSRPLWQLVLVTGLGGRRAAVVVKVHHAIADGTGALLLARHLVELGGDEPPPEPVDLAEVFAADQLAEGPADQLSPVAEQLRRGAGLAARLLGEAATALADPTRVPRRGASALSTARAVAAQVPGGERHTSPLWAHRSRNRRLELLELPLPAALDRARQLGGTLNDLFVTATLEGAVSYHRHFGTEPAQLTASIVVSTRSGAEGATANAFLPSTAALPAGRDVTVEDRFAAVSRALAAKREGVRQGPDVMGSLAGVAGLLPLSLTTGLAIDQVQRIDFATSNLRGVPAPVWLAGRRVTAVYPVGPVAGTAFNVTLMSNLDRLHLGFNIDPVAVTDPPLLRRCVADGFAALGVVPPRPTGRGRSRSVASPR